MSGTTGDDVNVSFGASLTGLQAGVSKAVEAVQSGVEKMNASLEGVAKAGEMVTKAFGAIAAIAAGSKLFGDALNTAKQLGSEVGQLSRQFDVTAEEASGMRVALDEAGLTTGDLQGIMQALGRQLKTNEGALNAQGVVTRQSNGAFVDQKTLLDNVISALGKFKPGTDQVVAAQQMFRGATQQTVQQLLKYGAASEDAEQKAKDFGVSVTADGVASAKEFSLALKDSGLVLEGLENTIGQAVMPAFTNLMHVFTDMWQNVLPGLQNAFKVLGSVLLTIVFVFQILYNAVKAIIGSLREIISTLIEMENTGVQDWAGVMAAGADRIAAQWKTAFKSITTDADKANQQLKTMWDPAEDQKVKAPGGTKTATVFDKNAASKELEQIKAHFKDMQAAYGDYAQMSAADEVNFWAQYLNTFKAGSKEALAVDTEYHKARRAAGQEMIDELQSYKETENQDAKTDTGKKLQIAADWLDSMEAIYGMDSAQYRSALKEKEAADKAYQDQQKSFEADAINLALDGVKADADLQDKILAYRVEMGEVSKVEAAQITKDTIAARYDAELAANAQLAALYADDLEKRHEYADKAVAIEREKNAAIVTAAQNVTKEQAAALNTTFGSVVDTIGTSLDGLLAKTTTWKGALQNIVQSLQTSFIKLGVERVKNWLFSEQMMTTYSKIFAAIRTALGWESAGETVDAKSEEADTVITENAGEAASGAASAMASIPYVGPILAVAAAAAMLAMVLGFKGGGGGGSSSGTPSAAKGWWEVPDDTLALIHKKEMVMPADLAQPLRDNIENGGGMGGGGQHFHAHISAIDAGGVRDFMKNHGAAVFNGIKTQLKDNKR